MNRRSFFKKTGLGLAAAGFSPTAMLQAETAENFHFEKKKLLRPARLREGATVALIAPSSSISEEKLQKALQNLSGQGFQIREGKSLRAKNGYLAGTDEERLADLHWAFADPAIEAIWCVRGGYGSARLLPRIDYKLIRRNPKIFIGYSDVTALHLAIFKKTGLVTFHGPVGASDFSEMTVGNWRHVLLAPAVPHVLAAPDLQTVLPDEDYRPTVISPGVAEGPLVGGNLSLLAALVGTPFFPSFSKKIVFIEDVGEQPYRLDRMLTQLLQATNLAQAAGIALGVFEDCQPGKEPSLSLTDALRDRLGLLGIPVVYGLPFGHISDQATLPYGIRARLDAEQRVLTLLEAAVV